MTPGRFVDAAEAASLIGDGVTFAVGGHGAAMIAAEAIRAFHLVAPDTAAVIGDARTLPVESFE